MVRKSAYDSWKDCKQDVRKEEAESDKCASILECCTVCFSCSIVLSSTEAMRASVAF